MRLPFVIVLAALAVTQPVTGQEVAQLEARLSRLDSLVAARTAELSENRQRERAAGELRSLHVGGFQLRVESELVDIARVAAAGAWETVGGRGGAWLVRELPRREIFVFRVLSPTRFGRSRTGIVAEAEAALPLQGLRRDAPMPNADGLRRALASLAEGIIRQHFDSTMVEATRREDWGMAPLLVTPASLLPPALLFAQPEDAPLPNWASIHASLQRTPARTNRECLAGTTSSCLTSLGVGVAASAPASTWYAPDDYRWIAASAAVALAESGEQTTLQRCVRHGDRGACETMVGQAPPGGFALPASAAARQSLVTLAIDLGGPGALDRLLGTPGSWGTRVAAAAGRPLPELAAEWQRRVVAAPLFSWPRAIGELAAALAGAAALLALTRRSLA